MLHGRSRSCAGDPTVKVNRIPKPGRTFVRHVRVAPGTHRGSHDARIRRGANAASRQVGYARPSATIAELRFTRIRSRPAAAAVRAHQLRGEPNPGQGLTSSSKKSAAATSPRKLSPAVEKGVARRLEGRAFLAGFPIGGM